MTALLAARIADRMDGLRSAGLLRKLSAPSGIDFSSNDSLGLSRHPAIQARMIAAIEREGCGSTGSRLLRGEREGFSALERRFAQFKRCEAALYFSSGYLANIAVLSTFPEAGDVVLSDALNHASLIDGIRMCRAQRIIFPHSDSAALYALLDGPCQGQRFIAAESVFSMDGDFAPLESYALLAQRSRGALIVDEAHAIGIYGDRGSGLADAAFLTVNPMGKAFGAAGAFVCGPAWAIEFLIQRARPFVFSTAPPPAVAGALDAALDVIEQGDSLRARLWELTAILRRLLADAGLDVAREGSHIVPVVIGDNFRAVAVAASLQELGFDVRAIRPPTVPEGTARLRVSVNALLTTPILRDFAAALTRLLRL